jgi:hypothetical protein
VFYKKQIKTTKGRWNYRVNLKKKRTEKNKVLLWFTEFYECVYGIFAMHLFCWLMLYAIGVIPASLGLVMYIEWIWFINYF